MRVLSMWLMKKSRKVVSVSTSMKDEHVSLPKPKSQLAQLHDSDEDVFATSVIDSYISAVRHGQNQKGYRIFLIGPGGTGKSHVVHLIQRDMSYFFKPIVKPDDDQPIVLITAPTGSAAFQIGGSTIHSALLLHDNYKSKPSWEKRSKMQIKLEHMMLSITDEISMVGFKQFQSMNEIM